MRSVLFVGNWSVLYPISCPFCAQSGFKRLGNHPPRCKERNGRDYSMYLSRKTNCKSKDRAAAYKFCPNCHKQFRRLDTNLRNSATCKAFPSPLDSVGIQAQLLQETAAILNFTPLDFSFRPKLKLQEEWEAANSYFANVLVPEVLSETSPSSKNTKLCDGIYTSKYGTKRHSSKWIMRRRQKMKPVRISVKPELMALFPLKT